MYKFVSDTVVMNQDNGDFIPVDLSNTEYKAYLKWAEIEGNVAEPFVPPSTVPLYISKAQGKIALIDAGLWPQVVSFIDSISDPIEKMKAEVSLNDTYEWRRDSPFLNTAAEAIGLSSDDLDNLFKTAIKIIA